MLAAVATFALEGVRSHEVTVEVDVRRGLPTFTLVGLPDRAVRESRERVRAALLNSGLDFPQQRLTVNLAPAHVRKAGPSFDLAIAVGVLVASEQIPASSLDPQRAVRRALAERGAAAGPRCARHRARGAARRATAACSSLWGTRGRPRSPVRRRSPGEIEIYGIPSLERLAEMLHGRWEPDAGGAGAPARSAGADAKSRPGRRPRPGGRQARPRDRRRRRSQPPDDRTAGRRKDDARPAAARHPPAAELRGGARDHAGARSGGNRQRPAGHRAAVSGAAPHGLRPRVWSAVARRPGRARSPSPTGACSSSTSCPSSPGWRSTRCVSRWRKGGWRSCAGQRAIDFPANAIVVAACNRCPCARPPDRCSCTSLELGRYLRRLSGPLVDRIDLVCEVEALPPPQPAGTGDEGAERLRPVSRAGDRRAGAPAHAATGERGALQRRHGRSPDPADGAARRPDERCAGRRGPAGHPQRPGRTTGSAAWRGRSPTWTAGTGCRRGDLHEALTYRPADAERLAA